MYSRGIDGAPSVKPGFTPADQIGQYVNATLTEIEKFISSMFYFQFHLTNLS